MEPTLGMGKGSARQLEERTTAEDLRASGVAASMVLELMDLPTFPQVATRLIAMTQGDEHSIRDVARVVEQDQAIAAKVLRVANSAMFGARRQIRTIQHATAMLGMENLRKYAMTVAVFGTRATSDISDYEAKRRIWVHAMAVAVLSRLIAERLGRGGAEAAVVAGLIHDIGKVVIQILRPESYDRVLQVASDERLDLIAAERQVLGTDHCAVGAELGRRWALPDDLVAVLAMHHDPGVVRSARHGQITSLHIVHVANFMCHTIGVTGHENAPALAADVAAWARAGLDMADMVGLLGQVESELERSIDYFDLGPVNLAEYVDTMDRSGRQLVELGLASEEAQRQLRRRIAELSLVTEGVLSLSSQASVDEILNMVATGALGQLAFDRTVVYTVGPDRKTLTARAVHGLGPLPASLPDLSAAVGSDPVVVAARQGVALRLRIGRDWTPGTSPVLDVLGVSSCGLVPLCAESRVLGLVIVDNAASGAPVTEGDIAVLDTIGKQIGLALDRAVAYERLAERAEELEDMAFRDALTGLHNLRYLEEALDYEIQRSERYKRPFSVLMLDVDRFKRVNDTYGHQTGDAVLRHIARVGASTLREADVFCRYGGEEFMALLPDTPKNRAITPAEHIRRAVETSDIASIVPGVHDLRVTVSIGVATYPDDARTRASLIGFADDALYRAKETGRNRVVVAARRPT